MKSNNDDVDGDVEREAEVGGEGDRYGRTTRSCSLPLASRPFKVNGDVTDTDSEITDRDEHDGRDARRLSSVPGKVSYWVGRGEERGRGAESSINKRERRYDWCSITKEGILIRCNHS